jgi:ssDNA-binding Zn-finger/Zn-ribbon topoisomerase 1
MKKLLILTVLVLLCSCSTYKTATQKCITYNDMKAARYRAHYSYNEFPKGNTVKPKLHKKNQFNPKKHYNERIWSKLFR